MTYYIGEVFDPESGFVDQSLFSGPFMYAPVNDRPELEGPLRDILALRFEWPNRTGFRSAVLSRIIGDTILRSELAKQAREDVVRKHSRESYLTRLEQEFFAVLSRKSNNLI